MATPELDIPAQVLVAKEYGFQGIDFRVGMPGKGEIPENISEQKAAQIKQLMGDLEIPGLLCYNKNIDAGEEEMIDSLLQCIDLAARLNCPMIRVFTGKIQTPERLQRLVQVLTQVLERDGSSVKLGLQIHRNNGVTVAEGLSVCRSIESSRVGLILSPDQSYPEPWEALIGDVAKYTHQIYVADLTAQGEFCRIGDGVIDYGAILRKLFDNGFHGYVTLKWEKCWIPQLPDYPEGFRSFMAYMNRSVGHLVRNKQ